MEPQFVRDVLGLIFQRLTAADLLSASQVCRVWHDVANDKSQLRTWTLDDEILDLVGTTASLTPMKPKTPPPKQWVNPAERSPMNSYETPKSLKSLFLPSPITTLRTTDTSSLSFAADGSPRTPSPIQIPENSGVFSEILRRNMKAGRYVGDVDVRSSRISDKTVQIILESCPNLHTLRLQHICVSKKSGYRQRANFSADGLPSSPVYNHCSCGQITETAFSKVSDLCPNISSVTLVLQHIVYRKVLRMIMTELGALPKLHTLSVELRMPKFERSAKSETFWNDHVRCTDAELMALIRAGPPPLQALALNRCDFSEGCLGGIATHFPNLVAIDLHSPILGGLGWQGLCPAVGVQLKAVPNLTGAIFGIFTKLANCHFDTWVLPALRRLRLETREALSAEDVSCLRRACPMLESLHLIWGTKAGPREAHIYPLTDETLNEYVFMTR